MSNDDDDNTREITEQTTDGGTLATLNRSELEVQIASAHKWPRSIKRFRDEALAMVTLNTNIADDCFYSLPRRQKDKATGQWIEVPIEGPSARFGEIMLSAWGNCRAGARVVSDQGDFVTAQGVFHDLERTTIVTYETGRRIVDSNGKRYSADMIGVTSNAACSIALRNAILKGIPKAFWSDLYVAARQCAMGDFKTLGARRSDAIKELQKYGISPAKIYARLGITGIEDVTLEHLLTLRGLLTAIRDGDTTPEQAFADETATGTPMPTRKSAAANGNDNGNGTPSPAAATPAAAPAAAPATKAPAATQAAQTQTGEVATPALVNYIKSKVEALALPQAELAAILSKHGATSIATLSPDAALQVKAQLVEIAEAA